MPGTKSGRNQNHNNKPSKHCAQGRTFQNNQDQQQRLAKLLERQEKKKNKSDNHLRALQDAQQRELEAAESKALLRACVEELGGIDQYDALFEEMYGDKVWHRGPDLFVQNFNRHQEQHNPAPAERDKPVDQDNHLNRERFRF